MSSAFQAVESGFRLPLLAPNIRGIMADKSLLDSWKSLIGFVVLILGTAFGLYAWAAEELEQRAVVAEAKQQIIHDRAYQNSRIARKEDQILENERQVDELLEENIHLTDRQELKVEKLDTKIATLEKDIEEIQVELAQSE